MGLTAVIIGGTLGVGAKGAMNNVMKVSARRAPWEYLIAAGVGAYVGNKIPQLEAKLLDDINAMRADRNMPPVSRVGGHSFGSSMTSDQSEDA